MAKANKTPDLVTLPEMEIFRAGDYDSKGVFSEADIASIASSYSPSAHHAPCTVDHEKRGPAYGWVKSLRAAGGSLFGIPEVLPEFAEALKNKRYPKRSVELYGSFGPDGKPYLKRLSFLGAQIPHIKGMADPEFAEGDSSIIEFADSEAASAFAEEPPHPADAKHGAIVKQVGSTTVLEHWHTLYVDAEGNGYTGPPMHYDSDYRSERVDSDNHQHLVEGGKIQPSTTSWNVEHVHGDYDFSEPDQTNREERTMATTTKAPKADSELSEPEAKGAKPAVDPKFAEIEAENARLRSDIDKIKTERADAEFSEAFDSAVGRGAIVPAAKVGAKTVFDKLRTVSGDVEFAEGDKTVKGSASDAFLGLLRGLPTPPPLGSVVENDGTNDPLTRAREFGEASRQSTEFAETKALAKAEGISFSEAAERVRAKNAK